MTQDGSVRFLWILCLTGWFFILTIGDEGYLWSNKTIHTMGPFPTKEVCVLVETSMRDFWKKNTGPCYFIPEKTP